MTDETEIKDSAETDKNAAAQDSPEAMLSEDVSGQSRRIKGVYDVEELADELYKMRVGGIQGGVSTGWSSLDAHYTVQRGEWTLITGVPGHGKSTFLDNLLVNLARIHGWKFLYFSFENRPKRQMANLMEIHSGKVFGKTEGVQDRFKMTDDEFFESSVFVQEHFKFIEPDEADCTVQGILDLSAEIRHTGFKFDGLVTDPYNELEHRRPSAMSETEYISWFLSSFRKFARREDVHWWCVAHPTKIAPITQNFGAKASKEERTKTIYRKPKLNDVAGSANWRAKADMGIVVYKDEEEDNPLVEVDVQKVRNRESGRLGQIHFHFDYYCNRYVQSENELLFAKTR